VETVHEPGQGKHLLIVEDDLALQKQIKWSLDRSNPSPPRSPKCHGAVAPACARRGHHGPGLPPDPDSVSEGFKLLEQILAARSDTKVIVLTGQNDQANALGRRHGRLRFLGQAV
jgi:two-component system NtrC family response regulator